MGAVQQLTHSSRLQQWRFRFQPVLKSLTGSLQCIKDVFVFTVPMLWSLAFIPNFVIGGVTGVMLGMAAADYQYHNSYFLVAHFHYVLIAGTVFACFAGSYYWYPKMFGHMLNEKIRKNGHFGFLLVGFNICFFPNVFLGLDGMTRRM